MFCRMAPVALPVGLNWELHHEYLVPFMEAAVKASVSPTFLVETSVRTFSAEQVDGLREMREIACRALETRDGDFAVRPWLEIFAHGGHFGGILEEIEKAERDEEGNVVIALPGIELVSVSADTRTSALVEIGDRSPLLDLFDRQGDDFVGSLMSAETARRLYVTLLVVAGRLVDALETIERTLAIYRRDADASAMAWVFYVRGRIRQRLAGGDPVELEAGIRDFSFSLILADPILYPRRFHRAVRALCETLPLGACSDHCLALTLKIMTMRFDASRPGRPGANPTPEEIWRRWLRALLLARFGAQRRAQEMLRLCRREFVRRRELPEWLVASLDLGEIFYFQARNGDLHALAAEIVLKYRTLDAASWEARGRLLMWRDAILHGDLDDELHFEMRGCLSEWMRWDQVRRLADPEYEGPPFTDTESNA